MRGREREREGGREREREGERERVCVYVCAIFVHGILAVFTLTAPYCMELNALPKHIIGTVPTHIFKLKRYVQIKSTHVHTGSVGTKL